MMLSSYIRVLKFLIIETGGYNTQYHRPYQTQLDGSTLSALYHQMQGSEKVTPTLLAGIANNFVMPGATPELQSGGIFIPGGWNEHRMRFALEVEVVSNITGARQRELILGSTDHVGATASGALDPNMTFFINNIIQLRDVPEITPFGQQIVTSVANNSHLLSSNAWDSPYTGQQFKRMRPEEVFVAMSTSHLPDIDQAEVIDTRLAVSNQAVKSQRANCLPTNFMSNVMNGYIEAAAAREMGQDSNSQIYQQARKFSGDQPIAYDSFLKELSKVQGIGSIMNTFTMRDILVMDANAANVVQARVVAQSYRSQLHEAGTTANWHGSDIHTQMATYLSHAVPALMMENALTVLYIKTTNHDFNSQTTTLIGNAQSFTNIDLSFAMERFKFRLENEILMGLSYNNQLSFALEMDVDITYQTIIDISINGQPTERFVVPSFCDALTVPVITADRTKVTQMARDFESLFQELEMNPTTVNYKPEVVRSF